MPSTLPYEANQDFNSVTRFLHSFRHRHASDFVGEVAARSGRGRVRVLEIGCAAGRTFSIIDRDHRVDYVGIDASPEFVAAARSRFSASPNATFICADAADPTLYAEDSADIVFALETLTAREQHVLRLMAEGRSNSAIAATLSVSSASVEKYVTSIFAKLGLPPSDADHRRVLAVLRYLGS